MNEHKVELRPIIGTLTTGQRVKWHDMELLLLNGKQIATINKVPGATIGLLGGVQLSASEIAAVESVVAGARGGVKPKIKPQVKLPYEMLDDELDGEDGDTDLSEASDE